MHHLPTRETVSANIGPLKHLLTVYSVENITTDRTVLTSDGGIITKVGVDDELVQITANAVKRRGEKTYTVRFYVVVEHPLLGRSNCSVNSSQPVTSRI